VKATPTNYEKAQQYIKDNYGYDINDLENDILSRVSISKIGSKTHHPSNSK
jgi:hypothetical protein